MAWWIPLGNGLSMPQHPPGCLRFRWVRPREGSSRSSLETLVDEGPFCAVFLDADKGSYDHYGRWATEHLRDGGLLIGDNALFFGRLLDHDDPEAVAMRAFHKHLAANYDSVCIPTPDGMVVGRKNP